jgi:hypothetical protein
MLCSQECEHKIESHPHQPHCGSGAVKILYCVRCGMEW